MTKKTMKRNIFAILLCALLAFGASGCGNDITEVENAVNAYMTAVSGFNLDAMQSYLADGENKDFGIDSSTIESDYIQTDTYKKSVESMFKALSNTIEFTINSSEKTSETEATVNVTLKCADVNKNAVDEYMQAKMDEYTQKHPELTTKSALDQNDIGISVMADAYKEFIQLQPKTSKTLDIIVTNVDGQWKIANHGKNADLKVWLSDVYGTF